jgi:hypothetical protein
VNTQQSAFDFVTHCLSVTDRSDSSAETYFANDPEGFWESVVDLANRHLLTPALWLAIQRKGLESRIPEDLRSYLEALYDMSAERNEGLRNQTIEAINALNSVGISPILMKGIVHLLADAYGGRGARVMTDIDILVEPQAFDACVETLLALGYQTETDPDVKYQTHRHCAPLFRPGGYGAIEVHRYALSGESARILSSDVIWNNLDSLAIDGVTAYAMKPGYRVLHTILHSELIDRHHMRGIMSLRYLHEVAIMSAVYGDQIDWKCSERLMQREGLGYVLRDFLYICHKLFGIEQPRQLHFGLRSMIHFTQCRMQLRYVWFDKMVNRMDRWLSRHSIIRRFGYPNTLTWMIVGRLRVLFFHLRRSGRQIIAGRTESN